MMDLDVMETRYHGQFRHMPDEYWRWLEDAKDIALLINRDGFTVMEIHGLKREPHGVAQMMVVDRRGPFAGEEYFFSGYQVRLWLETFNPQVEVVS